MAQLRDMLLHISKNNTLKWDNDDLLLEVSVELTKQSLADLGILLDSTHSRWCGYLELSGNQPTLFADFLHFPQMHMRKT